MSDIATLLHVDSSEDRWALERVQDVEPHLDFNKHLRSQSQKSDWGRHVAHIPNIFYEKWLREEWDRGNVNLRAYTVEFDELVERKLKDPDWKFLRVDNSESGMAGWSAGLVT